MSSSEGELIVRWLRAAHTRRMVARGLGGGEHPDETYLRMATKTIAVVVEQVQKTPWLTGGEIVEEVRLTGDTMDELDFDALDGAAALAHGDAPPSTNVWYATFVDDLVSRGYSLLRASR